MNLPTNVNDACEHVGNLLTKAISECLPKSKLFVEIHIEGEDNWTDDSCIMLRQHGLNGKDYDTGYVISPFPEVLRVSNIYPSQHKVEKIFYYVQHEEYNPGVWRYSDGSGEPPSSELIEDHKTDSPSNAVTKILILNLELELNQMFEAMAEEEMTKNEEF